MIRGWLYRFAARLSRSCGWVCLGRMQFKYKGEAGRIEVAESEVSSRWSVGEAAEKKKAKILNERFGELSGST